MIEKVILDYLSENVSYPVYMELPDAKDMPSKFYILEKTGSSRDNHINSATFAVQSYSDSMYESALMNDEIKKVMDSLITLDEITRSRLNTDYAYNNISVKKYRYQAIYLITHY